MEISQRRTGSGLHLGMNKPKPVEKEEIKENPKLMVRLLEKMVFVSVVMCFLGTPLFFTGLSFQGVVFEKHIFFFFWTLLAVVAWAGKGVIEGEMKIRRTPLDIPIIAFWFIYLLATIFSVDRWHSFAGLFGDPSRGFMSVTALVLMYYIIISNFNGKMFRWIISSIAFSGIFVIVWSTLGVMGINFLPEKIAKYAPLSLIGSISGLGMFLAVIFPILMTVIFRLQAPDAKKGKMNKFLTGIVLVGLIGNIFLFLVLHGFVPWIGFMIGVGLMLIFILSTVIRPAENWTWLPMASFVAIMVIWISGQGNSIARVDLPVEVSPGYQMSFEIAKNSLKENFFLGSGSATYGYDFSLFKPKDFNLNQLYNLRFYQASGIVFEAISTIGMIGALALIILILSFVSVIIFLLSSRKEQNKVYSLGFVTASLMFAVSAVLGRVEGSMIIFGVLISSVTLAVVMWESISGEGFIRLSLKASPKYALALAFIFMVVSAGAAYLFVFIGKVYAADIYAGLSSKQSQVTEGDSIYKMGRAVSLNKQESKYYVNLGRQYMVLANNEMLKKDSDKNINAAQKYLNGSIGAVASAKNISPKDVSNVEALAQIYENAGAYVADSFKLAEDNYKEALLLEPNNPEFTLALGKIKLNQVPLAKSEDEKKGLIGEAKDLFKRSTEEKSNFASGFYYWSIAQGASGEISQAIDTMKEAIRFNSNNIDYVFNLARLYQQRGEGDDNKAAESIFLGIIEVNDKEINTHFSLAGLYEKMGEKDKAVAEYEKVIELIPAENEEVAEKIKEMIGNVKSGKGNLSGNNEMETKAVSEEINTDAGESAENVVPTPPEASGLPVLSPDQDGTRNPKAGQ